MSSIPRQRSTDTADLDHTRPCRIGWCDRTCRWAPDPSGQVTRLHTRPVDRVLPVPAKRTSTAPSTGL